TRPAEESESKTAILQPPAELTPRGVGKRLLAVPFVVAIIVLGGFFSYQYFAPAKQIESIAVMPFVNESGNADLEYLSDGMTETLISSLSQLPNLNVKARSSVFRYKGKDTDPRNLAKELNVQAILNGRVTGRGDQLTVSLELIDPQTEYAIWSQQYSSRQNNLVTLQNEIARDVSGRLRSEVSGSNGQRLTKKYSENAEAYQLYLLGRFHWKKRTKTDIHKAIDYFGQAVTKDPSYALAYSGLADAYSTLQGYDKTVSPRESQTKAREYGLKALSLDDSLSEVHVSIGLILQNVDFDFAGAEREFRRAIDLDPKNADAYSYYALFLGGLGRFDEGETQFRHALELEPASQNINRNYGTFLMLARRYDESEKQLRKTIELDPHFQVVYLTLANTLMLQKRHAECVELFAKSREVAGNNAQAASMRASFARGGWRGFILDFTGQDWIADLRPRYQDAARFASIGENQQALDALEDALTEREGFMAFTNVDPRFDPLRGEPRFRALLKKIGFPE
ncbi:MAG TPA: tetratricopeptide repeat protein, partial [Pyrinomonadaceae bacterium]|nr:tetratricopeptide repeat protein [Pyrinomonadaceae bacterium]